ncbi:ubiquitin conjugation factor E4 A-like [Mercenaria mercenaria]|uniref:ubiquitin conjugation factor E4 A-like n=1 Tax=Mercenaria mercenaria TaxID=6596 RepID=UPI00234F2787|nr:ubiquitin conjugation factor E4 A-like [Mercenaria mercenaria]XP_053392703.1 ubiquitin conjugation factor E4 A-like [Mercenaria mercenaria]XP_053392704.1 ubiquitin conjugation factor E4 A-like [Mercenaria mercenaria]XP_053392705.1 ubiquitin conjugation factor E4 A-like [Mercenaria mercenaria]XP_053392706.1 ubiquitin conjugation factor E4 A-like [Mercenaria mercenaria]
MAEKDDIANNPFAALFPSLDQARLFVANKQLAQKENAAISTKPTGSIEDHCTDIKELSQLKIQISDLLEQPTGSIEDHSTDIKELSQLKIQISDLLEQPTGSIEDHSTDIKELSQLKNQISDLLEQVFLITLYNETEEYSSRPARCVYMSGLADTLVGQTWLDLECLDLAVFERLLLENPGAEVISTRKCQKRPTEASLAGESQVLRYLYQCFERCCNLKADNQNAKFADVLQRSIEVILLNAKTCMQQAELYPSQVLYQQFIDLYMENNHFLSDNSLVKEFFTRTAAEIHTHSEDGTLLQVFTPVLDVIKSKFQNELTLMHPAVSRYIDLLMFFSNSVPLAETFMEYTTPEKITKEKDFEFTLLGSVLGLSCIPEINKPIDLFNNPSSTSKQGHDITERDIWQQLSEISLGVYQLLFNIIKLSPLLKHKVLRWLGKCLAENSGRTKIWSTHAPQVLTQLHVSDGFSLNLCCVMLKLCQPFSEACSQKLLKIQPSYVRAVASDENDSRQRNIHAEELIKETCLIPLEENISLTEEESYSFITECFFLCHQAINQGFHVIHGMFLKLNQKLHRIQRDYQDMRQRYPNDDVEPMRKAKLQMEEGMKLFLCIKAALTEPHMLEMSMNFHIATATWLVQVARVNEVTKFEPVTFPLPEEVPTALGCMPEFIVSNVTDFTMFLHRFKHEMFESGGRDLTHFMTLILVFMGNPERMKNPHLRAELAETLAALMPQNSNVINGSKAEFANLHLEQLFANHPLIDHLAEKLIHVFVSIEMTGQSVDFEQKFNYRQPMYQVLHYIWGKEIHRNSFKGLADSAEENIENKDPPLFLRFINLLINDAIFLLDEALNFMKELKEKQAEKDGEAWQGMDPNQQLELEDNIRQLGMMARYRNVMGNMTILSLEMITRENQTIFCHEKIVDRIAAMLNYFLLRLVGPRQKDFKVKDKNEFEFKPGQLVSDITKIYLNLSKKEGFCEAVCGDGRSYSEKLFQQAIDVLLKIGSTPVLISDFERLRVNICEVGRAQQEEEELLADPPEEFTDPIMGTLMKDPVKLPTSGNIVDRAIISRHILSDQMDPFNRQPLTLDMVVPVDDLRERIHAWIKEQKSERSS